MEAIHNAADAARVVAAHRSSLLSEQALRGWITALPAARYVVRLVPADPAAAPVIPRVLDADGLLGSLRWLRHLNAQDHHVLGRPDDRRVVLVDDLDADGLARLRGVHVPAAVVETSPGRFQAWLRLLPPDAPEPPPALATAAARGLAALFGGDGGAADHAHLGRVPGTANRKAKHRRADGSYPWALLRESSGTVCPHGLPFLVATAAELHREPTAGRGPAAGHARRPAHSAACSCPACWPRLRDRAPEEEHQEGMARIRAALPAGTPLDRSRADYALARRLLGRGASPAAVEGVILAGERAREMPCGRAEDYARRTVAAALQALAPAREPRR